ncbi:SWFGD domain-containing protein [Altererythrobacter sp. HHU K3-1]|uniref:SWFGD domain-containing protein n=2 Tax=Qipengyuania atrilutea TaxID=2744473 RepID=A0A850H642_9SPHN|nr:SWFGD domain-containing protein [Actirhodobacter atriluteus]
MNDLDRPQNYSDANFGQDQEYSNNRSREFGMSRDRYGSRQRNQSEYNTFDDYDRDDDGRRSGYRRTHDQSHSYFRGDEYGGPSMSNPRSGYGNYAGGATMGGYGSDRYTNRDRGFFDKAGDEIASWFGDEDAERRREQDHRGRGPSNYKRSDERILEDSCDRLTEDRTLDASNIEVTVQDAEVTLDGKVDSLRSKRRAEDCIHHLSGVNHVQNNLRVDSDSFSNNYNRNNSTSYDQNETRQTKTS